MYGVWHCVFQVNNYSNRLAITKSRNLVLSQPKVYIKMVNLLNYPVKGKININGKYVSLNTKLHLLTGDYDTTKAIPQTKNIIVTPSFEYGLPTYSFSLIELYLTLLDIHH